jgi:hypothetical protein
MPRKQARECGCGYLTSTETRSGQVIRWSAEDPARRSGGTDAECDRAPSERSSDPSYAR